MKSKIMFPTWLGRLFHHLMPNIGTVLVVAALLFANNVYAANLSTGASPSTISYQGTLSTAGGTAVNANIGLTFRLYDVQSGGNALWTETHSGVPVNNGLFNVLLGSITPIPASVWDNNAVYLGVQVDGDSAELLPREIIGTVPYSVKASNANTIHLLDAPIMLVNNITTPVTSSIQWVSLNLSQYVPPTAKSVLLDIGVFPAGSAARLSMHQPGSIGEPTPRVESAGYWDFGQGWVNLSNQAVEYQAYGYGSNLYFYIQIVGYIE